MKSMKRFIMLKTIQCGKKIDINSKIFKIK